MTNPRNSSATMGIIIIMACCDPLASENEDGQAFTTNTKMAGISTYELPASMIPRKSRTQAAAILCGIVWLLFSEAKTCAFVLATSFSAAMRLSRSEGAAWFKASLVANTIPTAARAITNAKVGETSTRGFTQKPGHILQVSCENNAPVNEPL